MHTKTTLSLAGAIAVLGIAGTAEARPYCGDADVPCPTPTQDAGQGTATGTVAVAKGYTLTVRKAPNTRAAAVRKLKNGATVRIVCQTVGQRVSGKYGTSVIWDKLARGGYVSDTYIYTGSDGRVAKDCGEKPAAQPNPSNTGGRPASIQMKDDYPFKAGSWNDPDPWGFFKRECTSFVAYRLNKVMNFSNYMKNGHFGDAGNWDDNARKIGFKVNKRATPGSVLVRNSGTYGHVAIVVKATKTKVFVEQYNAGGTHTYSRGWLPRAGMVFIHFR